jgi:hypothetical protein
MALWNSAVEFGQQSYTSREAVQACKFAFCQANAVQLGLDFLTGREQNRGKKHLRLS